MITAKPGNWLFVVSVHCPVPRLNSTRAPSSSSGVEFEPVEVELGDLDDMVGLGKRRIDVAPLPDTGIRHVPAGSLVKHWCVCLECATASTTTSSGS